MDVQTVTNLLRLSVSIIMITFGWAQFINPSYWLNYLPDNWLRDHKSGKKNILKLHAIGNISLGSVFFLNINAGFTMWFILIWWLSVLPFAFYNNWTIGLRDLVIIVSIISFIILKL